MVTAADYLGLLAWLYLGAAALAVGLTAWLARGVRRKLAFATVVFALFAYWPVSSMLKGRQEEAAFKAKLDKAAAHFEMRCKSAGEKIKRTVEGVDGVVWMRWRDKYSQATVEDDYDQFKLSDPYGRDCRADECIERLLRATHGVELDPENKHHAHAGYRFIESVDPHSGQLNRYTRRLYKAKDRDPKYADWAVNSELVVGPIRNRSARYGITWDDISTREDREHWIAGGSIKVIDLQTNEVIAERVGYMMDRGQGSRAGARTPWLFAEQDACPQFPTIGEHDPRRSRTHRETVNFVSKVLLPNKGE